MRVRLALACFAVACGGRSEIDPGDAAAGAPTSYCAGLASRPLFCDDFDEGNLSKWSSGEHESGTIGVADGRFRATVDRGNRERRRGEGVLEPNRDRPRDGSLQTRAGGVRSPFSTTARCRRPSTRPRSRSASAPASSIRPDAPSRSTTSSSTRTDPRAT